MAFLRGKERTDAAYGSDDRSLEDQCPVLIAAAALVIGHEGSLLGLNEGRTTPLVADGNRFEISGFRTSRKAPPFSPCGPITAAA